MQQQQVLAQQEPTAEEMVELLLEAGERVSLVCEQGAQCLAALTKKLKGLLEEKKAKEVRP
jgi:hypothetical protein